jgi:ribonuclease BN (tRNA processing enzyme)
MHVNKLASGKRLSLSNDGKLSLFFVGVGSAFTKRHFQTNLIIIKGNDHVLIDCGSKTPQAFYELGLKVSDIRNFLITHSHADHIGGLEEVMLTGRFVTKKKPVVVIDKKFQQILWDLSLRGGAAYNDEKNGSEPVFSDMWRIIRPRWLPDWPRETHEVTIGGINLKTFRTMHIPESARDWESSFWSCGIVIDDRVMFTSDTRFDPDLIENYCPLFDLEFIFHDCQFFTGGVHAGIDELSTLPPEIKKKMILTHFGDDWEDHEEKVRDCEFFGLARQWHLYDFD